MATAHYSKFMDTITKFIFKKLEIILAKLKKILKRDVF